MKDRALGAIALGVLAIGAAWTVHAVKSADYCPSPSAASIATLLAPCQAFDTAIGRPVTREEAIRVGLLAPDTRPGPFILPRTQLAEK